MAVKISVMSYTYPALAAKIANEIAKVLDSVKNEGACSSAP
ncbi:MAG: hypothetical protein U5L09_23190 [Bacteroidales bacterium]|nr:hypothetical protein [Bacteroidales bacterium]